jgi:putative tryptophan/tyrosine transport system substrate-binding protein
MRRRDFIKGIAGLVAAEAAVARAQPAAMPVIGYLGSTSAAQSTDRLQAFREGLKDVGLIEGTNAAIEFRWADSHFDRLPAMAAELARDRVAVIIVTSTPATFAAKAATDTIPIVFGIAGDPVELGLVASLNRPNGNLTGTTLWNSELVAKRLELLHELDTATRNIGLLVNPTNPTVAQSDTRAAQEATDKLGLNLQVLNASNENEIDAAIANLSQRAGSGLLIGSDIVFFDARTHIVAVAARNSIPAMYDRREYVTAGGLISYGSSLFDLHRQVGVYAGRILKGESVSNLPVLLPSKYEFVINLKTAKSLGLSIPQTLSAAADEVIE